MTMEVQIATPNTIETQEIETRLIVLRGQKVLIDRDVAELYGVETKRVNEAVKNNPDKFPATGRKYRPLQDLEEFSC